MTARQRIRAIPWPQKTRQHYIKLFSLQERLRAHLKVASDLLSKNRIAEYHQDQVPEFLYYLPRMQTEISKIKRIYTPDKHGRWPIWYKNTHTISDLTEQMIYTSKIIDTSLAIFLRKEDKNLLPQANYQDYIDGIVKQTVDMLADARQLRKILWKLPLDGSIIAPDDWGIEAVIDLSKTESEPKPEPEPEPEQHFLDLTPIWQRSQQNRSRG